METPVLDGVLFILARLVEFFNIGVIILFAIRGVPAKYIYAVLSVTILSLISFVVSLLFKGDTVLKLSFLITLGAFFVMVLITRHALKKAGVSIVLPEGARCPVCSAFIKPDKAIALSLGNFYLFFDEEDHLKKFLASPEEYAKIRKIQMKREDIGKAYIYKDGLWSEVNYTRFDI
ncbi:hypothetical protein [Hydrogenobacter thermophilus]|uniref:hypothetical protein n=1 Tax=Hydrogenobacter thermophilus TaxID=940 RepID=UPI0030F9CF2A